MRGTRVELAETKTFIISCNKRRWLRAWPGPEMRMVSPGLSFPRLLAPSPSGSSPPTPLAPAQPVRTHVGLTPFHKPSPQTESRRPGGGHVSLPKPSPRDSSVWRRALGHLSYGH